MMMEEDEEESSSSSSSCSSIILEITLISAQSLKPPSNLLRRFNAYATLIPPTSDSSSESSSHGVVLRTRTDPVGSTNPTWNDKFLLRIHPSLLSPSSSASISVDILADAGFLRPDPLVGSVRLLLSNHHGLLDRRLRRPSDLPTFAALGIRRPSGRFHGVLNVAFAVLSHVPNLVHLALSNAGAAAAVGYRDLMKMGMGAPLKELNYYPDNNTQEEPNANSNKGMSKKKKKKVVVIKKKGDEEEEDEDEEVEEEKENLCGLGFGFGRGFHLQSQSRNHVSPSDQILNLQHIPWVLKDRSSTQEEEDLREESIH